MITKLTKTEIHNIGIEYTACKLIEQGISTKNSKENGIDLILNNNKTILVRSMSEETRLALTNGTLDYLKADYLIIASNLKFTTLRKIYIMTMNDAKEISINKPYIVNNRSDYFINQSEYIPYRNNYSILI